MNESFADKVGGPQQFLDFVFRGWTVLFSLSAVASLKIADHLGETPVSVEDLATATSTDVDSLRRLVGLLVSEGFLIEDAQGKLAHTEYSRVVRSDHPMSIRPMLSSIRRQTEAGHYLDEGVRTGKTPYQLRFGKPIFEHMLEDPEYVKDFAEFLAQTTTLAERAIFNSHTFNHFKLAVDVGGNQGSFITRMLALHPESCGVLFDLPNVVAQATDDLDFYIANNRLQIVGGSFFESMPEGGDLYLLKQVLHDWKDQECITILRNIRRAMSPQGRLAVIERLIPASASPDEAWAMDIWMFMLAGGRERTLSDYRKLFAESGFAVDRVTSTESPMNIIEAVPI